MLAYHGCGASMTDGSIVVGGELARKRYEDCGWCALLLGNGHGSGDSAEVVDVAGDNALAVAEEKDVTLEEMGVSDLILGPLGRGGSLAGARRGTRAIASSWPPKFKGDGSPRPSASEGEGMV